MIKALAAETGQVSLWHSAKDLTCWDLRVTEVVLSANRQSILSARRLGNIFLITRCNQCKIKYLCIAHKIRCPIDRNDDECIQSMLMHCFKIDWVSFFLEKSAEHRFWAQWKLNQVKKMGFLFHPFAVCAKWPTEPGTPGNTWLLRWPELPQQLSGSLELKYRRNWQQSLPFSRLLRVVEYSHFIRVICTHMLHLSTTGCYQCHSWEWVPSAGCLHFSIHFCQAWRWAYGKFSISCCSILIRLWGLAWWHLWRLVLGCGAKVRRTFHRTFPFCLADTPQFYFTSNNTVNTTECVWIQVHMKMK